MEHKQTKLCARFTRLSEDKPQYAVPICPISKGEEDRKEDFDTWQVLMGEDGPCSIQGISGL